MKAFPSIIVGYGVNPFLASTNRIETFAGIVISASKNQPLKQNRLRNLPSKMTFL